MIIVILLYHFSVGRGGVAREFHSKSSVVAGLKNVSLMAVL